MNRPPERLWPPQQPTPSPPPGNRPGTAPPPSGNPAGAVPTPAPSTSAGAAPWPRLPRGAHAGQGGQDGAAVLDPVRFRAVVAEINARLDDVLAAAEGDQTRARLAITEQVRAWVAQQATAGVLLLPAADQARLIKALIDERFGFGPLQPFLDDPDVEEILVNGPGQVLVHYAGNRKEPGPLAAADDAELADMVRRWAARTANPREFSPARPMLNIALGVGVRMAATMSISQQTHVAIRKQRLMDTSLADLVGNGTLDDTLHRFLSAAIRARRDLLITGGVNAGKTTLMRALCGECDPAERLITLESERELYLDQLSRHHDVVSFEAREANQEGIGALNLVDIFPMVLRMRPDRVLVGEVRHAEILALLQAIDNGLEGSMTTLHANSGAEVFGRILTLCGYSHHRLDTADLFRLVGRAIDLIVHVRRDPATGNRHVSDITEVLEPAEGGEPAINRIFTPGPGGRAVPTGITPACIDQLEAAGFGRQLLGGHGPGLGNGRLRGYAPDTIGGR